MLKASPVTPAPKRKRVAEPVLFSTGKVYGFNAYEATWVPEGTAVITTAAPSALQASAVYERALDFVWQDYR